MLCKVGLSKEIVASDLKIASYDFVPMHRSLRWIVSEIVSYDLLVGSYDFIAMRRRLRYIVASDVQIVQCIAGVASYDHPYDFVPTRRNKIVRIGARGILTTCRNKIVRR